jgi:hypothetical protein
MKIKLVLIIGQAPGNPPSPPLIFRIQPALPLVNLGRRFAQSIFYL